ncbi:zinc ribbon domain-containing protein [Blautia sp.]|uniref:zinc ribbon domain-containing protein n=1 Tax=Blautia sp. TaxID=1955243 RepID=UPI00262D790A|nr:zinc ribbon domain-containing protein [Blautia sp.]
MFCEQCGKKLPDGARFCPICGTPAPEDDENIETQNGGMEEHVENVEEPIVEEKKVSDNFETPEEPKNNIRLTKKAKIVISSIIAVVIIGAVGITAGINTKQHSQAEKKVAKKEKVEMTDEEFIQNGKKLFQEISNKMVNDTQSLTLKVECHSYADVEYEDMPMHNDLDNNADVFFYDGNVHLLGEWNSTMGISKGELFLRGQTVEGDTDEKTESAKTEVYVTKENNNKYWLQEYLSGYVEKTADDSGAITLNSYLGFLDEISKNLDTAQIQRVSNGNSIEIKGTISGARVCDAYRQILFMTGCEPEYKNADMIPYTLRFSCEKKKIEFLEFDMGEIAEYTWYGSQNDGLEFESVTGTFKITFKARNKTESFDIPKNLVSKTEEINNAGVDWKSAYKEYIMTLDDADTLSGYNLIDVNQDNLPELFIRYPMTYGEVMIYVNKEGNAQLHRKGGVNGYTANTGMVWSVTGHGSIEENFCQYNKDSGQFETVHLGRYEVSEEDIYEFDGKKCRDQEEYDKLVKDIFDKKNYMKIEFQLFSSDNHIQELLEFVENY